MSTKPSKDHRIITLLAQTLMKLEDFSGQAEAAASFAADVVAATRANAADVDEFKDQVMGIVANVPHLNGELTEASITPEELAKMDLTEMLSREQKRALVIISRKRAKEQTDYDKTSLLCKKCGMVRADRININELGLDSEENGSHFEYNFDNMCNCSHSSSDESDSSDDDEDTNGATESTDGAPESKLPKTEGWRRSSLAGLMR